MKLPADILATSLLLPSMVVVDGGVPWRRSSIVRYKMRLSMKMESYATRRQSVAVTPDIAAAAAATATNTTTAAAQTAQVSIVTLLMATDWSEFHGLRIYFERVRGGLVDQVTRFVLLCTCLDEDYATIGDTRRADTTASFDLDTTTRGGGGEGVVSSYLPYKT